MSEERHAQGWSTRSVHGTGEPGEGPIVTPVYQTSTFAARDTEGILAMQDGRADPDRFYTRNGNPSQRAAAVRIADLEGCEDGLVTASGMAAISTVVLGLVPSGGRIVTVSDLYGNTYHLMRFMKERFGVTVDVVDTTDAEGVGRALADGPADLVYLETPTNPTLRLTDLAAAARAARDHGVVSAVDSTFASPFNTRPHALGVDLVLHSATKYLAGHSDVLAGAITGSRALIDRLRPFLKVHGGILDPHAAFLLERGVKTLPLRMERHNRNAMALARHLAKMPGVARVHYPGLPSHPQHALARQQMPGGFGGVLSVDLDGGETSARAFADALSLFRNAPSLGGLESLVSVPVFTSHRNIVEADLSRMGITPGTVRLACGVEDSEDLIADVTRALDAVLDAPSQRAIDA